MKQELRLDKLLRMVVRALFSDKCARCGGVGTEVHHIIRRGMGGGRKASRWEIYNTVLLCAKCHRWTERVSRSDELTWVAEKFPAHYGYYQAKKNDHGMTKDDMDRTESELRELLGLLK